MDLNTIGTVFHVFQINKKRFHSSIYHAEFSKSIKFYVVPCPTGGNKIDDDDDDGDEVL